MLLSVVVVMVLVVASVQEWGVCPLRLRPCCLSHSCEWGADVWSRLAWREGWALVVVAAVQECLHGVCRLVWIVRYR